MGPAGGLVDLTEYLEEILLPFLGDTRPAVFHADTKTVLYLSNLERDASFRGGVFESIREEVEDDFFEGIDTTLDVGRYTGALRERLSVESGLERNLLGRTGRVKVLPTGASKLYDINRLELDLLFARTEFLEVEELVDEA